MTYRYLNGVKPERLGGGFPVSVSPEPNANMPEPVAEPDVAPQESPDHEAPASE